MAAGSAATSTLNQRIQVSFLIHPSLGAAEWPQLRKIENDDCQDRTKLDHNTEHFQKFVCNIQFYKLFHKNHVSGTGDGGATL